MISCDGELGQMRIKSSKHVSKPSIHGSSGVSSQLTLLDLAAPSFSVHRFHA